MYSILPSREKKEIIKDSSPDYLFFFFFLFYFIYFFGWYQGFNHVLARQVLYDLSHTSSLFALG
jgi:hypothetical protein